MIVYCLRPARKYFVHEKEDVTIASEGLEDVGLLLGIYGLFIVLRLLYYCPGACILNDHTRSPCNSLRMQRLCTYTYRITWGALYDKQV